MSKLSRKLKRIDSQLSLLNRSIRELRGNTYESEEGCKESCDPIDKGFIESKMSKELRDLLETEVETYIKLYIDNFNLSVVEFHIYDNQIRFSYENNSGPSHSHFDLTINVDHVIFYHHSSTSGEVSEVFKSDLYPKYIDQLVNTSIQRKSDKVMKALSGIFKSSGLSREYSLNKLNIE